MAARTFDAFTTPKAGVIWGLTVPQLLFLSVATFPAWMAISSQRWLAGVLWVPVWLLVALSNANENQKVARELRRQARQ